MSDTLRDRIAEAVYRRGFQPDGSYITAEDTVDMILPIVAAALTSPEAIEAAGHACYNDYAVSEGVSWADSTGFNKQSWRENAVVVITAALAAAGITQEGQG